MATITAHPAAYSTSGTINGTRYRNCIGKGADTTATGNDYASRNSTATIFYTFDFSAIPAGASIQSVEVKVGGHRENATNDSTNKADLALYSGDTAKGTATRFTSTSKQIVTMDAGTWTREELRLAQLRFTIAYYGGLVNGVDFTVTYTEQKGGTNLRVKLTEDGPYVPVLKILRKPEDTADYVEITEEELPQGDFLYVD